MKISNKELQELKNYAENVHTDFDLNSATARSSAYLTIETIHQLNKNTRNNILFTLLGATLGFLGSVGNTFILKDNDQKEVQEELQQLQNQLTLIEQKLSHYQMYYPKKDSLQISSKKE
jgi:hypothetical protein